MKKRMITERAGVLILFAILLTSTISAYTSSNYGLSIPGLVTPTTNFDSSVCSGGEDFIAQIAPLGCTPAVVRSDLLEEQDVSVFCQLAATQINPLINVATINSIVFNGTYPNTISGIGFFPAKAALGVEQQISNPVLENIGYVMIKLKQQPNESSMPEFVQGNLTANLKYDLQNSLGIGTATLYVPELTDADWKKVFSEFSFWNGKGFLKTDSMNNDQASISVYDSNIQKSLSVVLKKGETSQKIYLPGFNCLAGFSLRLDDLANPDTRATLKVNADGVQVAAGEQFLSNKCTVRNLQKKGLVQKADISCNEDQNGFFKGKTFSLIISPKITLTIDGLSRDVGLGDYLYDSSSPGKYVYLAYIGTKGDTGKKEDLFAYLLETPEATKIDKLTSEELNTVDKAIQGSLSSAGIKIEDFLQGKIPYLLEYNKPIDAAGKKAITLKDFISPADKQIDDSDFNTNYDNAITDYNNIVSSFPNEKYPDSSSITLGEQAMYNEMNLMYIVGKTKSLLDLCEKFKQDYPKSNQDLSICTNPIKLANSEMSTAYVMINGKVSEISLAGIYAPDPASYSAQFIIEKGGVSKQVTLTKNGISKLNDAAIFGDAADSEEFIQLISLGDNSGVLNINLKNAATTGGYITGNQNLVEDTPQSFGSNYKITLKEVTLKKIAKVSVVPSISATGSKTSFQFKIGIEKRDILPLVPAQMKKTIQELNNSISKWQNISDGLAKFIEVGKTACLATGAVLVVKNFAEAFSGKAIARQTIMKAAGGWNEKCAASAVGLDKCLLDNAPVIDSEVNKLAAMEQSWNDKIKAMEPTTTNILGQKDVDNTALAKQISKQVSEDVANIGDGKTLADPSGTGKPVDLEKMKTILASSTDADKLRDINIYTQMLNSGNEDLANIAKKNLYLQLYSLQVADANTITEKTFLNSLGISDGQGGVGALTEVKVKIPVTNPVKFKDIQSKYDIPIEAAANPGIDFESYVYPYKDTTSGKQYLFVLDNDFAITQTYSVDNGVLTPAGKDATDTNPFHVGLEKVDATSYQNKYITPQATYYETQPYQGMPAVVPFDTNNGWYAQIKPILPILGGLKSYDESGRVSSFWLCNVGLNGKQEGTNIDKCQQIDLNKEQSYTSFAGLNPTQTKKLVDCADNAIQQASTQHKTGVTSVQISTDCGGRVTVPVGNPAADIPDVKCQDFMSPKDCQLLFNVCDPFICPSSRCDMGGTYHVKDVVQSGIIGSVLLCLPNFKEGILLPVCITGIQAGIDGFLSVEKSYRDCLQNTLNTGQVRGVCDEIHSLYLCDFFWRQTIPLAKIALPNLISAALGQGHGGGEYLTVNSAFDNAQKSFNYFVQYYGENAGKAFTMRTAEEFIGDAVCKTYSSAVYPSGADLISTLTKPTSPSQFYGRFDEIPFTTVTNPPISQYKVFYHIFAGNDKGAYYQVYLKGSTSSYYQDTSAPRIVASGYINAGASADEAKDFTAPSGYKQLCINVNGQEECGFQQTTTDFGINYASQTYAASQANNSNIKTEADCNSQTVYNSGITRICATNNPGQGTDSYIGTANQRWVEVGYCDNTNVKCWLDMSSVKSVITIGTIQNQSTTSVEDLLRQQGDYMSQEEFKILYDKLGKEAASDKITDVNKNLERAFNTNEKGDLLLWRGDAYSQLAVEFYRIYLANLPQNSVTKDSTQTQKTGTSSGTTKKTYKLDSLGFSINGGTALYDKDVTKKSGDKALIVSVNENNCDKTEYQIYLDKKIVEGFIKTIPNVAVAVWNGITGKGFNNDEPASGRVILGNANDLLDRLAKGTYYVNGFCLSNSGKTTSITSKNHLIVSTSTVTSNSLVVDRFVKLQSLFEKYSTGTYYPLGWNPKTFEALLIAIAQRQSNLGYSNGVIDTTWLMEYGWVNGVRLDKYAGQDTQVKSAATTLRDALNYAPTIATYQTCNNKNQYTTNKGTDPASDSLLKCVLSVYMTGINSATSIQGAEAADEVISLMIGWKSYLNTGNTQGIDKYANQAPASVSSTTGTGDDVSDNFWVFDEGNSGDGAVV